MKPFFISLSAVLILELIPAQAQVPPLLNFQGRVKVGSADFNGTGQFKFALVNNGGSQTFWSNNGLSTAGSEPTAGVLLNVVNGLYSVQLGDVGLPNMTPIPVSVFTNADVRLRVWFNDGVNGFQRLTPDQRIASVGYAMTAATVADGSISSRNLADGAVTAAKVAQHTFLRLGGEASGAPLVFGTTDNEPVEITAGGRRVWRGEPVVESPGAPNLIGGYSENAVAAGVKGATIAGGGGPSDPLAGIYGANLVQADFGTIGGGHGNTNGSRSSTIGGGGFNTITGIDHYGATLGGGRENVIHAAILATVAGGNQNRITNAARAAVGGGEANLIEGGLAATIAGGTENRILTEASYSAIAGGWQNTINRGAARASIGGGLFNRVIGTHGVIPGGDENVAGTNSFAAGHRAKATHTGSFLWADSTEENLNSSTTNEFLVRATGGVRFQTAGAGLFVDGTRLTAGSGAGQSGVFTVEGVTALRLEPGDSGLGFRPAPNVIGGSSGNRVSPGVWGATISGGGSTNGFLGQPNVVGAPFGTIGGGQGNVITEGGYDENIWTTISGGAGNTIVSRAIGATIGGGVKHLIQSNAWGSTIAGGYVSLIQTNSHQSTISGGRSNLIGGNSEFSTIVGGEENRIAGRYGVVSGGRHNLAGTNSFAAGTRAKATHTGAFVWADPAESDFATTATNQFLVRASGGVGINTTTTRDGGLTVNGPIHTEDGDFYLRGGTDRNHGLGWYGSVGATKPFGSETPDGPVLYGWAGGILGTKGGVANWSLKWDTTGNVTARGTINQSSDRNLKTNFVAVNPREVLAKVSAIAISSWEYKESPGNRHVGPMAQDFHAAFGLGASDRTIATVDADGVALAAIQGVHELVREKEAEIRALREQVTALEKAAWEHSQTNQRLEARLDQLERSWQSAGTARNGNDRTGESH